MNIKKHIPNALTCGNLLCGCLGIAVAFQGNLINAAYCTFVACVFDFFDGFAARALKVSSPIGKDLDSLADMVTFGVLPGVIMFQLLRIHFGYEILNDSIQISEYWIPLIAFIITVFSALRLAKFNNDTRQSDRFIGVPTPANALFISALPFLAHSEWSLARYMTTPLPLLILIPILCYLLVAELPLIALKFKNYGWPDNKMRYILIISALLLLLTLNFTAIPIIIILYIILSLIENKFMTEKGKQ